MGLLHHVPVELKNYNDFDIHQVLFNVGLSIALIEKYHENIKKLHLTLT
jgi:hypothetical protein